MNNAYSNPIPYIKASLIEYGPQTRAKLIELVALRDIPLDAIEKALNYLLEKNEQVKEEKGLLRFVEPVAYSIYTDGGYIGKIQQKLAQKGYRWLERTFNDGMARDTRVQITRDTNNQWEEVYSPSALTTGWGRFERFVCWCYVEEWIDKGGFAPAQACMRNSAS